MTTHTREFKVPDNLVSMASVLNATSELATSKTFGYGIFVLHVVELYIIINVAA